MWLFLRVTFAVGALVVVAEAEELVELDGVDGGPGINVMLLLALLDGVAVAEAEGRMKRLLVTLDAVWVMLVAGAEEAAGGAAGGAGGGVEGPASG